MVKKIQLYLNIVLILFFVLAVIYFAVVFIINLFKEKEVITSNNLSEYIKQSEMVVNYYQFGIVENCMSNFYEAMLQEDYDSIYSIVGDVTKKNYPKNRIISELKNYRSILGIDDVLTGSDVWLDKAYVYKGDYIAKICNSKNDTQIYMIFNYDSRYMTYTIDLIM